MFVSIITKTSHLGGQRQPQLETTSVSRPTNVFVGPRRACLDSLALAADAEIVCF